MHEASSVGGERREGRESAPPSFYSLRGDRLEDRALGVERTFTSVDLHLPLSHALLLETTTAQLLPLLRLCQYGIVQSSSSVIPRSPFLASF